MEESGRLSGREEKRREQGGVVPCMRRQRCGRRVKRQANSDGRRRRGRHDKIATDRRERECEERKFFFLWLASRAVLYKDEDEWGGKSCLEFVLVFDGPRLIDLKRSSPGVSREIDRLHLSTAFS